MVTGYKPAQAASVKLKRRVARLSWRPRVDWGSLGTSDTLIVMSSLYDLLCAAEETRRLCAAEGVPTRTRNTAAVYIAASRGIANEWCEGMPDTGVFAPIAQAIRGMLGDLPEE